MVRIHLPPRVIQGARALLTDPHVVHYLLRVRRLQVGDPLVGFDGRGIVYDGRIERLSATEVSIRLLRQAHHDELGPRITLAQAVLKGSRFDWVVQKATELGVATIVPLMTRHTVARPAGRNHQKHLRWQRIAAAAAQQCGRSHLPAVAAPLSFEAFAPTLAACPLVLIPTLTIPTHALQDVLQHHFGAHDMTVMIGPEGDFSPEEVRMAQRYGAQPVSLGTLTLRAETAALVILAMLRYAMESSESCPSRWRGWAP